MGNYFFLDLETTGLSWQKNAVIQISAILERNGHRLEDFSFFVKPHQKAEIAEEAMRINRISREEMMNFPPAESVFQSILAKLRKYAPGEIWTIIAYNTSFDVPFMRDFMNRCAAGSYEQFFARYSIDPYHLALYYLQYYWQRRNIPNMKLKSVASFFGIEVVEEKLHNASHDVELLYQIYKHLEKYMPPLGLEEQPQASTPVELPPQKAENSSTSLDLPSMASSPEVESNPLPPDEKKSSPRSTLF